MYVDMENYKEEDVKDRGSVAYLNGYMAAYNDVDPAFETYKENVLSEIPSETMRKMTEEICRNFADHVKRFIHDERQMALVSILDEQEGGNPEC